MTYVIFLILFAIGAGVYIVGSFFNLYHIYRFGYMNTSTRFMIAAYLGITLVIFMLSGWYIARVDWTTKIFTTPESPHIEYFNNADF